MLRTDIVFHDHAEGARQIEALLGVPARLLRDGEGWATEDVHPLRHAQLHPRRRALALQLDDRAASRPQTIDELPLEWFFSDGVVLDMTAKGDGERVDVADVEAELERIGHELAAARHRAGAHRPRRLLRRAGLHGARARRDAPRRPAGCASGACA